MFYIWLTFQCASINPDREKVKKKHGHQIELKLNSLPRNGNVIKPIWFDFLKNEVKDAKLFDAFMYNKILIKLQKTFLDLLLKLYF